MSRVFIVLALGNGGDPAAAMLDMELNWLPDSCPGPRPSSGQFAKLGNSLSLADTKYDVMNMTLLWFNLLLDRII